VREWRSIRTHQSGERALVGAEALKGATEDARRKRSSMTAAPGCRTRRQGSGRTETRSPAARRLRLVHEMPLKLSASTRRAAPHREPGAGWSRSRQQEDVMSSHVARRHCATRRSGPQRPQRPARAERASSQSCRARRRGLAIRAGCEYRDADNIYQIRGDHVHVTSCPDPPDPRWLERERAPRTGVARAARFAWLCGAATESPI